MNKKIITISSTAILLALPLVSLAFNPPAIPASLAVNPSVVIDAAFRFIWPIIAALTVIMFIWSGIKFMTAQGDPSKVEEARKALIWGVVGTAVIILSWSMILIVAFAFGFIL